MLLEKREEEEGRGRETAPTPTGYQSEVAGEGEVGYKKYIGPTPPPGGSPLLLKGALSLGIFYNRCGYMRFLTTLRAWHLPQ